MKMPEKIEPIMFAPCGMNCMVCYKHCLPGKYGKPCSGCTGGDAEKPEHCRKCAIKDCLKEKGVAYCYECILFPCPRIKRLEKSYNVRYGASLIKNSLFARENGLESFMAQQKIAYTCPKCGGVVSIHDKICSECRTEKADCSQWK